jgi:hypothetical protein
VCKAQHKLDASLVVKQIGGRADCRNRGNEFAEEFVLDRTTKL